MLVDKVLLLFLVSWEPVRALRPGARLTHTIRATRLCDMFWQTTLCSINFATVTSKDLRVQLHSLVLEFLYVLLRNCFELILLVSLYSLVALMINLQLDVNKTVFTRTQVRRIPVSSINSRLFSESFRGKEGRWPSNPLLQVHLVQAVSSVNLISGTRITTYNHGLSLPLSVSILRGRNLYPSNKLSRVFFKFQQVNLLQEFWFG